MDNRQITASSSSSRDIRPAVSAAAFAEPKRSSYDSDSSFKPSIIEQTAATAKPVKKRRMMLDSGSSTDSKSKS